MFLEKLKTVMRCHISLYINCHQISLFFLVFVGASFGFPISTQKLPGKGTPTVHYKTIEYENLWNKTSNVLSQGPMRGNSKIMPELQDVQDLETETEVNLEHVRKKLNDDDLYEHVPDKNNVSQRSFVFMPASKYKIPSLYPLARPQKIVDSAYDKTFISNIDSIDDGPTGRKSDSFMKSSFVDTEMLLDDSFYNKNPLENEMDILTNKVKAANGIIHMQYNSVNKDLINMDNQFSGSKSDTRKAYFKDESSDFFEFKLNKKPYDLKQNRIAKNKLKFKDYMAKQHSKDLIDSNSTGVNVNELSIMGDRYDYVELIKPALLRPEVQKKPVGLKSALYDNLKLDIPYQSNSYKPQQSLSGYSSSISEPYRLLQFNNIKGSSKQNTQPYDSMMIRLDSRNSSSIPVKLNSFSKGFGSRSTKTQVIKSDNFNSSRLNNLNLSGNKPSIDVETQTFGSDSFTHSSRSPTQNTKSEFVETKSDEANLNPSIKALFTSKPSYQERIFAHGGPNLIGKPQNNFKNGVGSKKFGHEIYPKNNIFSEHYNNLLKQNPYQKTYRNNIAPYKKANKLKENNILTNSHEEENSVQTESKKPIKHIEFYSEDEEPDFHNSLLAKKVQEMRDLEKQFNDDSTSHESGSRREINLRNDVASNEDQQNRKVNSLEKKGKVSCVYPDCEKNQKHSYSKVKQCKEKCDCNFKESKYKVKIRRGGQIMPLKVNASTDFQD